MTRSITLALFLACLTSQGALKVMTIGDSLTEEYHFETPFSAPDSDPFNANTVNWVEILTDRRGADIGFGGYEGVQFAYPDHRRSGYEYNWGIPGFDTVMWMDIIHAGFFDPEFISRARMWDHYGEVDVVVVMLGGNDVRSRYGDLYDAMPGDATAVDFINTVVGNLEDIIDEIRGVESNMPIVLANVPDLGATPDKIEDHPDASKRANASAIIADLNDAVASLANAKGSVLAPVSQLTDKILQPGTFYLGALPMVKDKHPENPPSYLFCKAGLHPSTNGQAVIANILLAAINSATGSQVAPLPDREIISELLGLNPDQPFIDWLSARGIADSGYALDTDGDGIPNLGEYLLALDPLAADDAHISSIGLVGGVPTLTLDYSPDAGAGRLARVVAKQSDDLVQWTPVAGENIHALPGGAMQVRLPANQGRLFLRLDFELRP